MLRGEEPVWGRACPDGITAKSPLLGSGSQSLLGAGRVPWAPNSSLFIVPGHTKRAEGLGCQGWAEEASSSGPGQKSSGTRKEEEEDDGEQEDRRAAGPQRVGVRGKA